ncbi:hypothetical protein CPC16_003120, partial [Podila verticillata]
MTPIDRVRSTQSDKNVQQTQLDHDSSGSFDFDQDFFSGPEDDDDNDIDDISDVDESDGP